jgi:hypothetical protein
MAEQQRIDSLRHSTHLREKITFESSTARTPYHRRLRVLEIFGGTPLRHRQTTMLSLGGQENMNGRAVLNTRNSVGSTLSPLD